ncbi:uncharacterized protein LOC143891038 [Tasmannia lanceolata]|uniref:uncharacterized protein LOC143891038 n=1 Tax=Tasmannia lanceolata TaxID=3420 RepID=UPI0040645517
MKFITPNGVGEVRGDQPQSMECYAMALRGKNASESLPIELLDLRDEAQVNESAEDLIPIPLFEDDGEKVIQIGSSLDSSTRQNLTQFVRDNADVFTWAPADMPGIDPEGTYCYRIMPFGLKNAGATYQKLVNKLYEKQIGCNMEVYADDMLVKSQSVQNHVSDLKETFQVLREHNMKLNPTKCTFGVSSKKFLGFMVSRRGIEANPEKIKAVVELTPPKTIREVHRLTGMVAALGHFISKSAERCLPFFNAVKGIKTTPWTQECQVAFDELKQYLSSPPLLTKPEPGDELLLYISVSPMALAAVLIREEHNQQKPIYYVSKVLHDAEIRYQWVEKLAYALIMTARKLRPYFQAHTIKVLTDQPLRQVLHRPDTSGRLVKWTVELSEFDIQYLRRPAIKAQVLADFVAECTIHQQSIESEVVQTSNPSSNESIWEVYVDGSSNKIGCGAGLILTGPDNFVLDYALRFRFHASNNEAEYEALIAGMNLAVQTSARRLKAYCDSQLVANQIQGVYEAHDERMIKYLSKVRQLASKFKNFKVIRIPRTENAKADVLSKLAASSYTTLGSICIKFLKKSSIKNEAVEVMQVEHEPCWMDEIIEYLRSGKLPEAKKEACKVIQRAARFSLDGESLYKRSYTLPYLKCLRLSNTAYTLQETHEGI